MKPDKKPDTSVLTSALESWRDFYRWRLSLRSTLKGRAGIFIVQFVIGVVIAQLVREFAGAPNNLISYLLTMAMGIGVGIAGPLSFSLASIVFWGVLGTISGLAIGVWPYLPSWWREAHQQWVSGATIPSYVVGGAIVAVIIWTLSSVGVAKLRDNMMPRLIGHAILKLSPPNTSTDEVDPRLRAMPTDAEAERLIRSALEEDSGSLIRKRPKGVNVVLEKAEEPELTSADLTDELVRNTATGTADLEGLESAESLAAGANLSKRPVAAETPSTQGNADTTQQPKKAPSASPPPLVDGNDQFRLKALVQGYEMAMEAPDQYEALDRFAREFSAVIEKLSLPDLDFIKTLPSGEGLHSLVSGMTRSMATVSVSSPGRTPDEMFGAIDKPADNSVEQAISEATSLAAPVPSPSKSNAETRSSEEPSVPNPDAQADVPVASGSKATSSSLARMLYKRTANSVKDTPAPAARKAPSVTADVADEENANAETQTAQAPKSKEKPSVNEMLTMFGIAGPHIMGDDRDRIHKAALAGLPLDGIEEEILSSAAEGEAEPDVEEEPAPGGRFAMGASTVSEPSSEEPSGPNESTTEPLPVSLDAPSPSNEIPASQDPASLEEESDRVLDDVTAEADAQTPSDDFAEVIGADGLVRFVSSQDVGNVTRKDRLASPLDELPEVLSDDDLYELGLLPYDRILGPKPESSSKDTK